MGKFWSLFFFAVPVLGVAVFVIAWMGANPTSESLLPLLWERHWMPEDVSEHGHRIDSLFFFILWLTGAVFVVTDCALPLFMWMYDAKRNAAPVKYTHGSHNLEVVWTVLPAAVLLFIALHQMDAWAEAKLDMPENPQMIEVTGRQFEWRIRYPGADGALYTPDDVLTVNDLHIPVDEDINVVLKSEDVLHSFFLPNLRIKQDAVPGMKQNVWFKAKKTGEYDIVCAELCGWGHYKMKGRLTIQSRKDYDHWMKKLTAQAHATQATQKAPPASEE